MIRHGFTVRLDICGRHLRTPLSIVDRSIFLFGVGGSGRSPVESADPGGHAACGAHCEYVYLLRCGLKYLGGEGAEGGLESQGVALGGSILLPWARDSTLSAPEGRTAVTSVAGWVAVGASGTPWNVFRRDFQNVHIPTVPVA